MTTVAIKPIRTETDYATSLALLETLMDAEPNSTESDYLGVLAALIEQYEDKRFPIAAPTPLGAIRFRMEQLNLNARDLIPYIGSRARVSEILNGQRSLSIDMVRALNKHLHIPADVLIGEDEPKPLSEKVFSKPVESLLTTWNILKHKESFDSFLKRAFGEKRSLAMLRQTKTPRTNAKADVTALQAWCAASVLKSKGTELLGTFHQDRFDSSTLREIAKLSVHNDGPALAKTYLSKIGISLVVLPHLPNTHLDGAATIRDDGVPVISMTLRRNRVDNFWFTLLHECAHVAYHLGNNDVTLIVDDLEISSSDDVENEADTEAKNALIPQSIWRNFNCGKFCSSASIDELAKIAGVNPAIVAGRWQKENNDFRKFSKMLGHGTVRDQFPDFEGL